MKYSERQELINTFIDGYQTLQRGLKRSYFEALGDTTISPAQIGILFLIDRNKRVSGREIASQIHITKSAVSQLVDGLEHSGYVSRSENPDDRRISYLELTRKGKIKVSSLQKKQVDLLSSVSETLTLDELLLMIAIHEKMNRQLENK